jgi:hypothetical protein
MAALSWIKRWKLRKRQRQEVARLEAAFRRKEVLDTLLFNPMLRKLSAQSGEPKTDCSGKRRNKLNPLPWMDRLSPSFHRWRVLVLRRLCLKGLSLGVRILSARCSRS